MNLVATKAKPRLLLPAIFLPPPPQKLQKCHSLAPSTKNLAHLEDHLSLLTIFFHNYNHHHHTTIAKPDYERSLVSALKSCSALLATSQAKQLHSMIFKSAFLSNIFICNSLISFYSKSGSLFDAKSILDSCAVPDFISCNIMLVGYVKFGYLQYARDVFDKMPHRSDVSFTTMIMGLAQGGCWYDAVYLFNGMRRLGLVPNEVTMSSVLSAYSQCGGFWNGGMLHTLAVKIGVDGFNVVLTNLVLVYCSCLCLEDGRAVFNEMPDKNIVAWNVMLNGYSKGRDVDLAMDLFERMPERDVVSWGTIINGYVQIRKLSEVLMLYRVMLRSGVGPNDVMIVNIISSCAEVMAFYEGSKDHLPSWNALISGLVRNGMIDHARQVFDEMPEKDVFSWSSMISGYAQTEQPRIALELFNEMMGCGIKPNEITMVSVLSAIATLGIMEEGRAVHEYICSNSIPLNDNLSAAIIDMYAKCGSIAAALDIFNHERDKVSTISPWNAIICGSAMHGHAKLSLEIYSDLQKRKIKLNYITFIGVLSACCHAGLVEAGEHHFKSMKSVYDVEPNIKHFGCMVDLLGRAGRLEDAEALIKSMPMKADAVIWGTLLAASRTHGNVEVGERAAESLARAEPSHGPARVLLSNIYAEAGMWDDAVLVRRAMQSQKLTRTPAYSGTVM